MNAATTRLGRGPFIKVPLTHGKVALVSPEDAERVLQHKWYADAHSKKRKIVSWRAKRSGRANGNYPAALLHRFILGLNPGVPEVDHKNGNGLDCRRGNIREASRLQNLGNRRKMAWATNKYRGIRPRGRAWSARIQVNGIERQLGKFDTPEEAARAYDEAARQAYGEFCCVNFPRDGERRAW